VFELATASQHGKKKASRWMGGNIYTSKSSPPCWALTLRVVGIDLQIPATLSEALADSTWYTLWRLSTFQDNGLCLMQPPRLTRVQFAGLLYSYVKESSRRYAEMLIAFLRKSEFQFQVYKGFGIADS